MARSALCGKEVAYSKRAYEWGSKSLDRIEMVSDAGVSAAAERCRLQADTENGCAGSCTYS